MEMFVSGLPSMLASRHLLLLAVATAEVTSKVYLLFMTLNRHMWGLVATVGDSAVLNWKLPKGRDYVSFICVPSSGLARCGNNYDANNTSLYYTQIVF